MIVQRTSIYTTCKIWPFYVVKSKEGNPEQMRTPLSGAHTSARLNTDQFTFCIPLMHPDLNQNIHSWLKILALIHFFQIMHHFSRKLLKLINLVVSTNVFLWFAVEQNKKKAGNLLNLSLFHRNPKMVRPTILLAPFRSCEK